MSADERPYLDSIIDRNKLSRFQILVISLCAAVMLLDGFDTQAIAFAAPGIAAAWHVSPTGFSFVFGIGLFGGLVGAISTGMVADRIGRRPTLVISVLFFGLATLSTPLADSMTSLSVIRFLTGLGVGGAIPGAIAIASEYASKRARATVAAVTFCGIPVGSVLASVLASHLIPANGWGSIFVVGGVLPLLIVPFIIFYVPESIRFLSLRQDDAGIAKVLGRMGVDDKEAARVKIRPETGSQRTPIWSLFTEGRAFTDTNWIKDHPTGTVSFQHMPKGEPDSPDNFMYILGRQDADFWMPRHRHNFEQIRLPLRGDMNIGRGMILREGEVGYFPEGMAYGPQDDPLDGAEPGERVQLVLQFGGSSGCEPHETLRLSAKTETEIFVVGLPPVDLPAQESQEFDFVEITDAEKEQERAQN